MLNYSERASQWVCLKCQDLSHRNLILTFSLSCQKCLWGNYVFSCCELEPDFKHKSIKFLLWAGVPWTAKKRTNEKHVLILTTPARYLSKTGLLKPNRLMRTRSWATREELITIRMAAITANTKTCNCNYMIEMLIDHFVSWSDLEFTPSY